jgi:hypothetical protein
VLVDHFKRIFFTESEPVSFIDPLWQFTVNATNDTSFTDGELVAALTRLNGNAAPGPEQVPSRVIKDVFSTPESRAPLLALMNLCFVSGEVPPSWGESEIFILYKGKGSRDDPNNYRGINLINDFSRIFERLLEARIGSWMSQAKPQGPMQFGFRAGVGTADAHMLLKTVAASFSRVHGILGYACFVDLQKAFPSVYRSKAIESLQLAGAPPNTIRALAASWSMNSCKLRVNSFLSKPFMINRGVKEGGINSPSVFSVVYARVLESIGVRELPSNLSTMDTSSVYYFAFADDLALFSGNLSRVEIVLRKLNRTLPEFGMAVNVGKTCWMPFVPTNSRYRVEEPPSFSLILNHRRLECVDEFKYLGFVVNSFLSSNKHLSQKRDLMFNAARAMGRLIRNLQITNIKSIRTYFYSLISSQLYGLEGFNFQADDLYRAAKLFLQTIFCLPDSYPINVARSLLNLHIFEATLLSSRIRFIERAFLSPVSSLTIKALQYNQTVLRAHGSGFTHDLVSFLSTFFDVSDLEDLSVDDLSYLQDLRDQIVVQRHDEFRVSFRRSSGLNFIANLSENAMIPLQFGEFLGGLEYEQARIIMLVMGDVFRFSMAATGSECPFCPIQLHTPHLFLCPNCPFRGSLPSWQLLLESFRNLDWSSFVFMIFLCLQQWMRGTSFFEGRMVDRVDKFLNS